MTIRQTLEAAIAAARSMALGGNLSALPLVLRPRALLTYTGETLFMRRALAGRRGVRESHVYEVLGDGADRADITLGNLTGETWFQPASSYLTDLVSLCLLCRALDPRVVFEIGTLRGYTALHFALNTPEDALVHTLDLPPDARGPALHTTVMDDAHIRAATRAPARVFEGTDAGKKVRPLYGDSARFDFSPYHEGVDLFFIDGAHSYEYVASDTRNALRCVRPGGVIAWHDFGRVGVNGVTRLVREVARTREVHAVPGGSVAFMVV